MKFYTGKLLPEVQTGLAFYKAFLTDELTTENGTPLTYFSADLTV